MAGGDEIGFGQTIAAEPHHGADGVTDPRAPERVEPSQVAEATAFVAGDRIGGYGVVRLLGTGGMGEVYLARDARLKREVAVKVMRPGIAEGRDRLLREAQAMARVADPHVVAVYECGLVGDGGQVFVAMELVTGGTLRDWLGAPRTWRAIVRAFGEAGRGLAAAHAAGLVHRDFKPENVLVGGDGRVRVGDFGLADDAACGDGAIAGTPAYMAPEQLAGAEVDARADQFAFGIALWEALSGRRPASGELADGTRAVPAWLRAIAVRTTRPAPVERFAAMDDVLAALARDPAVRRRRAVVAVGALGLVAVAAIGWARGRTDAATCREGGAIDAVWTPATAATIRASFERTGRPYAAVVAARTIAAFDAYAGAWRAMHLEACEATARGEQSAERLDLRMQCLDRRASELGALVTVFATRADADLVTRAVQAASDLPPLAVCADRERLAEVAPPPADKAPAIADLRTRLATVVADTRSGLYREAAALGTGVVAAARELAYPQLLAESLGALADAHLFDSRYADAAAELREALVLAARAHDDVNLVTLHRVLVTVEHHAGHEPAALALLPVADAAQARAGDDPNTAGKLARVAAGLRLDAGDAPGARADVARAIELADHGTTLDRADGQTMLALVERRAGNLATARAAGATALALYIEAIGDEHPFVAGQLLNLANIELDADDYPAAERLARRSLAIFEKALGPDHPNVGRALANLAQMLRLQHRLDEARVAAERSLAIKVARLGPDHPDVGTSLVTLGAIALDGGDPAAARPHVERALHLRERVIGSERREVADTLDMLGDIETAEGRGDAARADYERAVAIWRKVVGPIHPELARGLTSLARCDLAGGRLDDAIEHGRAAVAILDALPGNAMAAQTPLAVVAAALLRRDRFAEAREVAGRWVANLDALHMTGPPLAEALAVLGEASLGVHDAAAAAKTLERAADIIRLGGSLETEVTLHLLWGTALWDSGERVRARAIVTDMERDAGALAPRCAAWLAAHRP